MSCIGVACHTGSGFSGILISLKLNIFSNLQPWHYCEALNISSRPNFSPGSVLTLGFHLAELSLKVNKTKSRLYCWDNEKHHGAMTCVSLLTLYLHFSGSLKMVDGHSPIMPSGLSRHRSLNLLNS